MFKLFALAFAAVLAVVVAKPAFVAPGVSTYGYTGYPYGYSGGYASPYSYSSGYVAPYSAENIAPNAYSAGYVSPYSYSTYNGYYGYKYGSPYTYQY